MDVKRGRNPRGPVVAAAAAMDRLQLEVVEEEVEKKKSLWRGPMRPKMVLFGFLITLPLLVFVFGGSRWNSFPPDHQVEKTEQLQQQPEHRQEAEFKPQPQSQSQSQSIPVPKAIESPAFKNVAARSTRSQDKLLGGLLSSKFRESSCQSRYKSSLYRKPSPFSVSPYLANRLRKYEAYHKKCGPKSRLYKKAFKQFMSGQNADNSVCKYVVWYECNGLGNRMLTITATFLYALLTNRVLITHVPKESVGLFCEPFPGSSWVLPDDFPRNNPYDLHPGKTESYANMLKNNVIRSDNPNVSASSLPPYVYLHLEQMQLKLGNNIFCDEDQLLLAKFNWMILKSDSYFVPALFLTPMYEKELALMFPEKESVFHHLGRYLFHPSNPVWGIISRYYEAYLAHADERIGFQIRIFPEKPVTFENMYDQVIRCIREQELLPEISNVQPANLSTTDTKLKAVLVTSLYSGYYEKICAMYFENPTKNGDVVAVYQPSHEEQQNTEALGHNQKALAEIFLLSYCDKIAMSGWSTFGYVAYSFAGTKPWILLRPDWNKERSDIACVRSTSVEPCLHSPPILTCKTSKDIDASKVVPYVRHCEDVGFGLKLFDN